MGAELKRIYEQAVAGTNLVVTGPHYEWMETPEDEQLPSRKAMAHVIRVLLRQFKHQRVGRFSPSSMGECPRKVVFGYAGAPQEAPDAELTEMADHGTMAHLRWQLEGLTMGYMDEGEVWVEDKDLLTGGSMDGRLVDGSIFELKTAAPGVWNRIVLDNKAPKWEHLMQAHTYFILSDATWASVVYEDRAYGNFHEFRVERDDKIEREVLRKLRGLKQWVLDDELPPLLDMCDQKMGKVFRGCEYRKICHGPVTVTDAQALHRGEDSGRQLPLGEALPDWAQRTLRLVSELEEAEA